MADQHFRITADALGVEKAAKQVESAFSKIDKAVGKTTGILDKIGNATGLKRLRAEIELTERKFHDLAVMAQWTGQQINRAMGSTAVGGVHQAGNAARNAGIVGRNYASPGPSAPVAPRVARTGVVAARARSMENVPLFGGRTGLEQGQQVQNMLSGFIPLAAMGAVWGAGIKRAQDDNMSSAKLGFLTRRMGHDALGGALEGQSGKLRTTSGGDMTKLNDLMLRQAMNGETNAGRAGKNARLGLDIEAAGGSASEFVEALGKKGPEAAEAIADMAKSMGLQVREGASLAEVLSQLNERFGGLSAEVETSKSSFAALWKEIQNNLGMFGDTIDKLGLVDAASAVIGGRPDKAAFIAGQNAMPIGIGAQNQAADRANLESTALERLNSMRKSGQIDKKRHHELINKVRTASAAELFDMGDKYTNNTLPALAGGQASAGAKGMAVPEISEKEKKKRERDRIKGPKAADGGGAVRVILSNNPHSPTPMGARAF